MPSTNQLVRKGRNRPKKKLATPGLKSGQGRKRRLAAPQPTVRTPSAQRPGHGGREARGGATPRLQTGTGSRHARGAPPRGRWRP